MQAAWRRCPPDHKCRHVGARIPRSGLTWAVRHWEHTTDLYFLWNEPSHLDTLADAVIWDTENPAPALTELHIHYAPFPEEDEKEDDWYGGYSPGQMEVCLVACFAKMPKLKEVFTTVTPDNMVHIAGRLGAFFWWPCSCYYQDADGARKPPCPGTKA